MIHNVCTQNTLLFFLCCCVATPALGSVLDFIISHSILANLYHVILEHSPCVFSELL